MNFHRLDKPWSLLDKIIVGAIIYAFFFGPFIAAFIFFLAKK